MAKTYSMGKRSDSPFSCIDITKSALCFQQIYFFECLELCPLKGLQLLLRPKEFEQAFVKGNKQFQGNGCGTIDSAVSSDIREPGFESYHRQLLLNIFAVNCL